VPEKMGGRKRSSTGISNFGVGSPVRRTYAEASCRQSGKFLEARYTVTVVLSEYAVIRPESMPSVEITSYKPTCGYLSASVTDWRLFVNKHTHRSVDVKNV